MSTKMMTQEAAAEKIGKSIAKYVKNALKNNAAVKVRVYDSVAVDDCDGVDCLVWDNRCTECGKIYVSAAQSELTEEGACRFGTRVARVALEHLKNLPKSVCTAHKHDEYTTWHGWSSSSFTYYKTLVWLKPSKEFLAVNKKLTAIGCNAVPVDAWGYDEIGGKRDHVYTRIPHYFCVNQEKSKRILDYLKGKRKVSWKIKNEEHSDRDYGIEYETEWDGTEYHRLVFTDATGATAAF